MNALLTIGNTHLGPTGVSSGIGVSPSVYQSRPPAESGKVIPSKILLNSANFKSSEQNNMGETGVRFPWDFKLSGNSDYPCSG